MKIQIPLFPQKFKVKFYKKIVLESVDGASFKDMILLKVSFKMLACILKRNLDSTLEREDLDDYQRKRFYEPQEINKSSSLLLLDSIIIIQSWSKRRLLIRIFERKEGELVYIFFCMSMNSIFYLSFYLRISFNG